MKHTLKITLLLVSIFLVSQFMGLLITNNYIDVEKSVETGKTEFKEIQISGVTIERPSVEESASWVYILIAVLIGTVLVLLIIKFRKNILWKIWFFFAVVLCLTMSFSAFINSTLAFVISIFLGVYKVFKPNIIVHNLTELFIYGGLAVIFVPVLNLFSAFMLLLVFSLYDVYAVWKSKHMIRLAKFQAKIHIFAGLLVPYRLNLLKPRKQKGKKVSRKLRIAVLGGGDIGFPLLFSGVILKTYGVYYSLIVPPFAAIALFLLFIFGKKKRFYPAMPFLSVGCLVGFGVVSLIRLLV